MSAPDPAVDVAAAVATTSNNTNTKENATDAEDVPMPAAALDHKADDPAPATTTSLPAPTTTSTTTTTAPLPGTLPTSAHLAHLLAGALSDVESLREELAGVKKRAERAERLLATFGAVAATLTGSTSASTKTVEEKGAEKEKEGAETTSAADVATTTSPPAPGVTSPPAPASESPSAPTTTLPGQPPSTSSSSSSIPGAPSSSSSTLPLLPHLPPETIALLLTLDERTSLAEQRRDEALARLAAIQSNWAQLNAYLGVVEGRAQDARAGFGRIVQEGGGGGRLVLVDVPMPAQGAYGAGAGAYPANLAYGAGAYGGAYGGAGGYYGMPPPPAHSSSHGERTSRKSTRDTFGGLPLPPLPAPGGSSGAVGSRRPREASMDMYAGGNYPNKRQRGAEGEYDYHHPTQYYPSLPARYPSTHPAAAGASSSSRSHHPASSSTRRSPERQSTLASSHHGHRREARSRDRSPSTASDDLDALLLESANGSPRGGHAHAAPAHPHHPNSRSPEWNREGGRPERGATLDVPHVHGSHTPSRAGSIDTRGGYRGGNGGNGGNGGSEPSVFAPPVAQAGPQKKGTKDLHAHAFPYPAGQGPASSAPTSSAPSAPGAAANALPGVGTGTPFPPTNAANQRICRQCGLPGRYKEGKCVEKWGPGPLGPGTVCDRCRKKMKRVERRGTLEAQGQAGAGGGGAVGGGGGGTGYSSRSNTVHRTDTLPSAAIAAGAGAGSGAGSAYREREQAPQESSMRSSLAAPAAAPAVAAPVATPAAGRVIKNRLTPVPAAPAASSTTSAPPSLLPPLRTHSPMEVDGEDEGDSLDADAEAEVDEDVAGAAGVYAAHSLPHAHGYAGVGEQDADGEGDAEGEGDGDPEADLLEAVDAAEKATGANGVGRGRVKSED